MEVHGDINTAINSIPEFDVLCAGFPCQSFSKAGKQEGFDDKEKGQLFYRIVDILKLHKECKFIILENVRNLADKKEFWNEIQTQLKGLDFYITQDPIILSPDDFGVPQNRERVYILGVKKDLINNQKLANGMIRTEDLKLDKYMKKSTDCYAFSILNFDNKDNKNYLITNSQEQTLYAWEIFKKHIIPDKQIGAPIWLDYFGIGCENVIISDDVPDWKKKFIQRNRNFYLENKEKIDNWYNRFSYCLTNKSYRKFEWNCGANYIPFDKCIIQFRQSGLRIKRSDKFPSLVAKVDTPIIWDSKLIAFRKITVREASNLQSFNSDYEFICEPNTTYKQLGNSVNVDVISIIAKQLFDLANDE